MFGLWKKAPKLEMTFAPATAVARELTKEVEVTGELVVKNVGKDAEMTDLEVVLVAGGTRRIDLELPAAWKGPQRIAAGGELHAQVTWKVKLAAPMRAPAAEIQLNTTAGGKHEPLARSNRFPLANE
ncbi:MAG: hypothetical protein ACREQL_12815 [Candidatus Binatia bacterium]